MAGNAMRLGWGLCSLGAAGFVATARADDAAVPHGVTPTAIRVVNQTQKPVYANLILGQPARPASADCSDPGRQIATLKEAGDAFASSITSRPIRFVPQTPAAADKGYYLLKAGEAILYKPKSFPCAGGTCSPAMTYRFFFTPQKYDGNPSNACGASAMFPDAVNFAEGAVNFAVNGARGSCSNADSADISAVNGINAFLKLEMQGQSWHLPSAENSSFGHNANVGGVYGWAAPSCTSNAEYPNPQINCAAPLNAPPAKDGACKTPGGMAYAPITDPKTGKAYCDERSDAAYNALQGMCLDQRTPGITGGVVNIIFRGFLPDPNDL